jgi:hypothetical protein
MFKSSLDDVGDEFAGLLASFGDEDADSKESDSEFDREATNVPATTSFLTLATSSLEPEFLSTNFGKSLPAIIFQKFCLDTPGSHFLGI